MVLRIKRYPNELADGVLMNAQALAYGYEVLAVFLRTQGAAEPDGTA